MIYHCSYLDVDCVSLTSEDLNIMAMEYNACQSRVK